MSWAPIVWVKNQLSALINNVNDEINTAVEEKTKWYYSGKTGTEKILLNNEELLSKELKLPAESSDVDNNAYVVGFFVPKVSGLHTITLQADTLNAEQDATLCFSTFDELMYAVTNYNLIETNKIDATTDIYKQFNNWEGTYSSIAIYKGKNLIRNYLSGKKFNISGTGTLIRYCTKDEPVFLLAANYESVDITLWKATITVKYRETEPYEY